MRSYIFKCMVVVITIIQTRPLFSNTISSGNFDKHKLCDYIITSKTDSAFDLFKEFNEKNLVDSLEFNWYDTTFLYSPLSNKNFTIFVNQLISCKTHTPNEYHNYLKTIRPNSTNLQINENYIKFKLFHFNYIINTGLISDAEEEFKQLTQYLNQSHLDKKTSLLGEFVKNNYQIMMAIINQNNTMGHTRIEQNISIANQLNRKELLIKTLNQKLYILQIEKKLSEYLELAKYIIKLQEIGQKCDYYETILNYTSALTYLYTSNPDNELLNEIYDNLLILIQDKSNGILKESYILAAEILNALKNNPSSKKRILNLYGSSTIKQFVDTTLPILEEANTDLQLLNIYKQYAKMLMIYNYSDQGVQLMNKYYEGTRIYFTEEVSNITAKHDIDFLTQENAYKLKLLEEKDKLNTFILFACILIGALGIFTFKIMQKKNKTLQNLNEEKQFLLKEIHHRIKNNFQIASGMLQLEFQEINHPKIKPLIKQWSSKVNTIISIHKTLYQNDSFKIYLEEHLHHIIQPVLELYQRPLDSYTIDIDNNIVLSTKHALNLGVIINELITNSCKHNSNMNSLHLKITCKKQDKDYYQLTLTDNGKTSLDSSNLTPNSFGLPLIQNFVNKLNGTFEFEINNGAKFNITFKNN